MFLLLLQFEIKNRLGRISALVYFLLYFALAFLMAISFAGAFKGANVSFGLSNKLALNSPVVLNYIICLMGYLGLLITAPIFGQSINQDFETKFHQVLFATPIRKHEYFFVRYIGSFISVLCILLSVGIGIWFATLMPFVDRTLIAENHLWFYIAPYLSNLLPNTLIFGAVFIAVVSLYKKMAPVYVASISIFTGWMISQNITGDLDNKLIAALVEPFGLEGASQVIRYWSVAEQSTRVIPIRGHFLYNRLLWSTIGLVFLIFAYTFFNPFRLPKEKKKKLISDGPAVALKFSELKSFGTELWPNSWKVFWQLALSEFRQAFSNIYFLIILLCGVLYIFAISAQVGKWYGTETLPVTYHVLEVIGGSFGLFIAIIITYYAGELVWKDRDQHVYELVDSKPVPDFYLYLSKLFSLFLIQIFLSFVILGCCVLIQIFKGYYNFEWSVYVQHLFLYSLVPWFMTCIFAIFIQALAPNKYVGHSIVILYFILMLWLPSLGLDHRLYLIGKIPRANYSDMNRFGTSAWPFTIFGLYWGFFHLCLAILTILFWRRGAILSWKDRILEFKLRAKPAHLRLFIGSIAAWSALGGFIYYNTNILNTYKTSAAEERELVDYEHQYKYFEKEAQPDLISVNVQVDIFPERESMAARGIFKYRNNTKQAIKTILVNISQKSAVTKLEWNRPAELKKFDKRLGIRIFEFAEPLKPDEELQLNFALNVQPKGFENSEFSKKIVQNGSFFYGGDFFPVMGYQPSQELSEDKTRRKYGLADKPRMPNINDLEAAKKTYISSEGTWINFEATLSTSKDQIAIAPGYLQKEWEENGRRYFHYKMDKPILNFYAFQSARYAVARDSWNGINIEVYYHPGHHVNVQKMIYASKKSLDYFTKNFSPYQFKQVRIIEFPRYQMFAQSFPNTIPFSEAIGFIAKVNPKDPENIDYPFYVTAHEIAHQWWAHQVIGGNVQGATMLSESLAQYSALMVQEKEYGPQQMKKFLKYELDHYLHGRSRETKKELPLEFNENQGYIHYQKGSLVFYALKDYLGEDVVNKVLHDYIQDIAYQKAPFTRAIDLVSRFQAVTPEDKKYLIMDLFETITLYDNHTDKVSFRKNSAGKYEVEILATGKKLRADGLGKEQEIAMNDYIDVGIFDKNGKLEYLQKYQVKNGQNKFTIVVEREPSKAGIDPLNKLIDKVSDDNVQKANEVK